MAMKTIKLISGSAVVATAMLLGSCAMDAPFGDGQGNLTLSTEMNGEVSKTRGVPADNDYLREKCVVFIENSRGVMRKYIGADNIPSVIPLSPGDYVANAWSGDSVSASFSSKFYRGKQNFTIKENENVSMVLKCNIANVVTSVDPSALEIGLNNLKVNFSTSVGSLDFDSSNIPTEKGYFMTPSPETVKQDDPNTTLTISISGTMEDGTPYEKVSEVKNVQRAHEYRVELTKNEQQITEGGALISLIIKDIPIIEDVVEVFKAPEFKGINCDLSEQVVSLDNSFVDTRMSVRAYYGLSSLIMNVSDNFSGFPTGQNILNADVEAELAGKGILIEHVESTDAESGVKVDDVFITFSSSMLNSLAPGAKEYKIDFEATDGRHLVNTGSIRFANSEESIEKLDDIVSDPAPEKNEDAMAITGGHATLTGTLYNADAQSYGFKYRKSGTSEWQIAAASSASSKPGRVARRAEGGKYTVTITGLEPGTTYEYKAFADSFDSKVIRTFKTEEKFDIPNSSLETWGTYSASTLLGTKTVVLPGATAGGKEGSFWGSGNEGSATAGKQVLYQTSDMVHSGSFAAKLQSTSAAGVIAAGNLFVGMYDRTDGTNGVLQLGRPYNGSHPTKLRVWVHYRPGGNVSISNSLSDEDKAFLTSEGLVSGGNDQGQIYIALADEPIEVRTKPSDRKLFTSADPHVLAFGEVTWKENYGPDGGLQMFEITFDYKDSAKTKIPTHMIITCCATKFGDYFSGSSNSVMYLDDFEFIYE